MRYDFIIAVSLFIIASFLLVGAIYLIFRKEQLSGLKLTGLFVLANALYASFYAAFILNDVEFIKLIFIKIQHLAIPFLSSLWFLISFKLLNRKKPIKWYFYPLIFFIPLISMIGNLSYSQNGEWYQLLYYTDHGLYSLPGIHWEGYNVIIFIKGPLYYVQMAYNAIMLGVTTVNFFLSYRKSVFLARLRSLVLLIVSFIGFGLVALSLEKIQTSNIDFTPFFTSFYGFALFYALFHFELFELVPKAYQLSFEQSASPTLILDTNFMIVSMNIKAIESFDLKKEYPVELTLAELCNSDSQLYYDLQTGKSVEVCFTRNSTAQYFMLELLILKNQYLGKIYHGYCAVFNDITRQKEELAKLERMASYDELTQIYNRRHFYHLATEAFDQAKIGEDNLILTMFDLDDFKVINDIYGHQAGDYVLAEMSQFLLALFDGKGIFARYGGEEFIYMMTGLSVASARKLFQKICIELSKHSFIYEDRKIKITASFGVSGTKDIISKSLENYIKEADEMLYRAKRNGKNQVYFTNDIS